MRFPQLVIHETDGRLAALLRPFAAEHQWVVREPRSLAAARKLLAKGGPAVVVVKTGRDLAHEFEFLEQIGWEFPEALVVVIADVPDSAMVELAWVLGVAYVLTASWVPSDLLEIVAGLLRPAETAQV